MLSGHKPSIKNLSRTYFIIAVIFTLIFTIAYYYSKNLTGEEKIVENLERTLKKNLQTLEYKGYRIESIIANKKNDNYWPMLERVVDNDGIFIQIYFNDSLMFWNSNQILTNLSNIELVKYNIIYDQKGWYTVYFKKYNQYRIILYNQVKSNLSPDKSVLKNSISTSDLNCDNIKFTRDQSKSEYDINASDGSFLIGVYFIGENSISNQMIMYLFGLFLTAYIFILVWITSLYNAYKKYFKNEFLVLLFFFIDLLIIRSIEYFLEFPIILKDSYLFADQFEIISSFNSPGDLLINSVFILFASIQLFRVFNLRFINEFRKNPVLTGLIINGIQAFLTIGLLCIVYLVVIKQPYNSFYGFKLNGVEIIVSLLSLLILISSLFLINHSLIRYLTNNRKPLYKQLIAILLISIAAYYLFSISLQIVIISIFFLVLVIMVYYYLSDNKKHSFYKYLLLIIIYAAVTTYVINNTREIIKNKHQYFILNALSDSHDPLLENTFTGYGSMITQDTIIRKLLANKNPENKTGIENYLKSAYFSSISDKYNIQITICKADEMLEIKPEGIIINCSSYFEGLIRDFESEKISNDLYLIYGDPGSTYYVGRNTMNIDSETITLYTEFFFTYIPEGLGYPELLVSNAAFNIDLTGYSFARYEYNQLTNKFGDYPYLTSFVNMEKFADNKLFSLQNFKHIKHKISDNYYLVISRPKENVSVQLVTFSVLFVIYISIVFVVVLMLFGKQTINLIRLSFQARLQMIFLSTISLIIIVLTAITLFYADIDNKNRLVTQLSEKTNSVIIELQHKLSEEVDFYQIDPSELEYLLKKFSLVFFSDINLYSPSGDLISTSRPEIFNRGLLSDMVNPTAYEELFIKNKLFFITQEKIGKTSYYSSYAPIMLSGSQPAGMINLPYFAKQSEVSRSYYLMIFTFINLFVILGIIGSIIAIFLSRFITRPLAVLQENLSAIQIDKRNEIIVWKSNDEIGQLIAAYNDMIDKLEQSTELLKQSERESAWREVAQQIAHEIKNPLTPMKLNIQYLEKAYLEKDPALDEKVKDISKLLINQIETLNRVAEMFSDFAKTKGRKFEKVDLIKVIREANQLYKSHSNVKFVVQAEEGKQYITKAFEKDLLRVFNNLVKNAIYSIEDRKDGRITIGITTIDNYHQVDFSDNGKGIPDQAKANIFQPYFTTKSKGTGLGLAIVKNIMNEIGGEITFESSSGIGTSFKLIFPVFTE